jgi:hypothetical protein
MTEWRGPVNPSLNYTCGLLIEGFDRPPTFLMTYNPPYYAGLIEACGFAKSQDLYAYEMDVVLLAKLVDRYKPSVMSSLEGDDISVRQLDLSRLDEEIKTYLEIYNRSLEGTWGFTPLQEGGEADRRRSAARHRAGIRRVRDRRRKGNRRRARAARLQPDHPQAQRPPPSRSGFSA